MAYIRKRGKSWQATVYVGRDANGEQITRYITKPTKREVLLAAHQMEQEIKDGDISNVPYMPFSKYLESWFDVNHKILSPSTAVSYRMYIDTHIIPVLGNCRVGEITEFQVKAYLSDKLATISPTTVNKHLFLLKRVFRDALKHKSPAEYIKPYKMTKYTPYELSEEEFDMIYDVVKDTSDEIYTLLGAHCGMRLGEVIALCWEDVDEEKGVIHVRKNLAISDEGYVSKAPKSYNGVRDISATDRVLELFESMPHGAPKDRIFPIRPDGYSKRFHKLIARNNLPPIRFHDLRHYHASMLYEYGIVDQFAAERLGQDVRVTKTIYQHLAKKRRQTSNDRIKEIFSRNTPNKMPNSDDKTE